MYLSCINSILQAMKKEMYLLTALLFGVSVKSFAGTGNASDVSVFFLLIGGLLFIILGLISGIDYLRKNGKTMIRHALSFLKKRIALLRDYLHRVISDYFDLSYF